MSVSPLSLVRIRVFSTVLLVYTIVGTHDAQAQEENIQSGPLAGLAIQQSTRATCIRQSMAIQQSHTSTVVSQQSCKIWLWHIHIASGNKACTVCRLPSTSQLCILCPFKKNPKKIQKFLKVMVDIVIFLIRFTGKYHQILFT